MESNLIIELTLRTDSTADAEDTSGYALHEGSTTPSGGASFPIVVPVAIRLPLPGPAPERPLNFSFGEDVQGYVVDPSNRSAVLLIPAIVRAFNPQPDPPKTAEGHDVQGFRWMEEMTNTNEGIDGPSSGSWYGGLVVCYQFLTDPFGTFASAATNTKP